MEDFFYPHSEGFSTNLMATLQLGKSSWHSQILLVCCLGKGSATPERQTLLAPNHTPYGRDIRLNMPTLLLHILLLPSIIDTILMKCERHTQN